MVAVSLAVFAASAPVWMVSYGMSKVITFSTSFPSYHPRRGAGTYFVEKILNSIQDFSMVTNELCESQGFLLGRERFIETRIKMGFSKHHTIRKGNRWKAGEKFSPRIWSCKPYNSKQIIFAPDIEIKKIFDFEIQDGLFMIDGNLYAYSSSTELLDKLAGNDGLSQPDLLDWFKYPSHFRGQIICWNDEVKY